MSESTKREQDVVTLPSDIDMVKYILENAEIEHDEIGSDNQIILDNGIVLCFTEDGMLISMESR